jgi:diphthamide synthase (EF-2-diphthine--ammonia ligase)
MNTGVKLTTEVDYAVEILKKLEEKGVEVFSCGTCLKYYQLEDKLRVGKRAGTDLYLSGMVDFKKVVFIG